MGWYFEEGKSKMELVKELLTRTGEVNIVKSRLIGNNLWMAYEHPASGRFVMLYKLEKSGGAYGYKPISDDMGPYEHNCPLSFLEYCSNMGFAKEWAERVMEYHKRRGVTFATGTVVTLDYMPDKTYTIEGIMKGNKSYLIRRNADNKLFRAKRTQLSQAL